MMRLRLLLVLGASALLAGCWDFIDPEFAEGSASAVMQINASVDDDGNFTMTGLLVPGINPDGFVRAVVRDTLYIFEQAVPSDTTLPSGNRRYRFNAALGPEVLFQPFVIDPPRVEGVPAAPVVRWYSPRPLDPDTVRIPRGSDLHLQMEVDPNPPLPAPAVQWLLELNGRDRRFQISANGPPPTELRVPPDFIPEPEDSVVRVNLSTFQSAQPRTGQYRGAYSFTVRMDWTVILQ
jgi:hypothetical protein